MLFTTGCCGAGAVVWKLLVPKKPCEEGNGMKFGTKAFPKLGVLAGVSGMFAIGALHLGDTQRVVFIPAADAGLLRHAVLGMAAPGTCGN